MPISHTSSPKLSLSGDAGSALYRSEAASRVRHNYDALKHLPSSLPARNNLSNFQPELDTGCRDASSAGERTVKIIPSRPGVPNRRQNIRVVQVSRPRLPVQHYAVPQFGRAERVLIIGSWGVFILAFAELVDFVVGLV